MRHIYDIQQEPLQQLMQNHRVEDHSLNLAEMFWKSVYSQDQWSATNSVAQSNPSDPLHDPSAGS